MAIGIISSLLVVLLMKGSYSYEIFPKNPIVEYNGSITFLIMGFNERDHLREVSLIIPDNSQPIKLMIIEKNKNLARFSSYWSRYYYQTDIDKVIINNADYHIDGAKLEVSIFSSVLKTLVKLVSDPINIEYMLSSSSEVSRVSKYEGEELNGKEIIIGTNKISLEIGARACLNGISHCHVGFCREGENENTCKLYPAKKKTKFFNKKSVASVPGNKVVFGRDFIEIEGDPRKLLGSSFIIKVGNQVTSSQPISYGEAFVISSAAFGLVTYIYVGEHKIDKYDISLLSKLKNPHKLCTCSISTHSCEIVAPNLISECDTTSILLKEKDLSGIIMFSVTNEIMNDDDNTKIEKTTTGTAGFIQLY